MPATLDRVNPSVLRWAREVAGLTATEAAERIGLNEAYGMAPEERLLALEAGERQPTRALLNRIAKQYRRPLVTFFLSEPPRSADRGEDFRLLPAGERLDEELILDALLRRVKASQEIVRSVIADDEEYPRPGFVGSMSGITSAQDLAAAMRRSLPVTLEQYRSTHDAGSAFALLRSAAEEAGTFVVLIGDLGSYHSELSVDTFRGFALADDVAPFVVINDRDSRAAWSFTLLHELAHIWLGRTGVSGGTIVGRVEQLCNDAASEFLVPEVELSDHGFGGSLDELRSQIEDFAGNRNVSRSLVAYRLYRLDVIGQQDWIELGDLFRRLWLEGREQRREKSRASEGGPDWYTVRRHRIGSALLGFTRRALGEGLLTTTKAGLVLGVKPQQVGQLLYPTDTSGT